MVAFKLPPPSRPGLSPKHYRVLAGTQLIRIYGRRFLKAADFNHNGPRGRFDHHDSVDPPGNDPHHGVYYAADDLAGCIIEVFGDSGVIEPAAYGCAIVLAPRDLFLLDINDGLAWDAGSVAALAKDGGRDVSQAWARYFYEQTSLYGVLDGIRYQNAHNDAQAYVFFERATAFRIVSDRMLSDPSLEDDLFLIADQLGLFVG